jgi:hypothetical protein
MPEATPNFHPKRSLPGGSSFYRLEAEMLADSSPLRLSLDNGNHGITILIVVL